MINSKIMIKYGIKSELVKGKAIEPKPFMPQIDFTLEVPHLSFAKCAHSVYIDDDKIHTAFFIGSHEAIGDWGDGKIYVSSTLFKRKRGFSIKYFHDGLFANVGPSIKRDTQTIILKFIYIKSSGKLIKIT